MGGLAQAFGMFLLCVCLFLVSCGERLGVNFVGLARRFEKHVYIRAFSGYEVMFFFASRGGPGTSKNIDNVANKQ